MKGDDIMNWTIAIVIVLVIVCIGVITSFVIANYMFKYAITREGIPSEKVDESDSNQVWDPYMPEIIESREWVWNMAPQEIELVSKDGLRLKGYLLNYEGDERTGISVHGFPGAGVKDFRL